MDENLINKMKSGANHWYIPIIWGILFLGAGLYTFFQPMEAYEDLAIVFGILFLISGIFEIIMAFSTKNPNWILILIFGIITTIIGFMLVSNLALSMELLPWYVGLVILFQSISGISHYSNLKAHNVPGAGGVLFASILGIIIGFIMIINIGIGIFTVVVWTGIGFTFCGIFGIIAGLKLKSLKR